MKSVCIYCESESYGSGCCYSPTNTHVHTDNPGKCIYCGSPNVGAGCVLNPYGDIHIKASEFLNRSAVQTEKAAILSYFLNISTGLLTESTYKSPLDRLYRRISSFISSAAEPFLEAFSLQESPSYADLSKSDIIKVVEIKNKIKSDLANLKKTIEEANLQIPQEIVEKTIIDSILDVNI